MNNKIDPYDPRVIEDVGNLLQLPSVVEKDLYVTKVLHALSVIEDDYFRLVFQGGTCLAKSHQIIHRMSEDCDFRMEAKIEESSLSKEAYRRYLRCFRDRPGN